MELQESRNSSYRDKFRWILNMAIWQCSNQLRYLDACIQEQKASSKLTEYKLRLPFLDGSADLSAFCEGFRIYLYSNSLFFPLQWSVERLRSHDTYHLPCYLCIENGYVGLIQFRGKRPSPSDYWVPLWSQHPDSNVQSIRSHDGKHERSWLYSDCIVSYRQRCSGYILAIHSSYPSILLCHY